MRCSATQPGWSGGAAARQPNKGGGASADWKEKRGIRFAAFSCGKTRLWTTRRLSKAFALKENGATRKAFPGKHQGRLCSFQSNADGRRKAALI